MLTFPTHRNCEMINMCCFKPVSFRVICYAANITDILPFFGIPCRKIVVRY